MSEHHRRRSIYSVGEWRLLQKPLQAHVVRTRSVRYCLPLASIEKAKFKTPTRLFVRLHTMRECDVNILWSAHNGYDMRVRVISLWNNLIKLCKYK